MTGAGNTAATLKKYMVKTASCTNQVEMKGRFLNRLFSYYFLSQTEVTKYEDANNFCCPMVETRWHLILLKDTCSLHRVLLSNAVLSCIVENHWKKQQCIETVYTELYRSFVQYHMH